jgi:hypothetical protein
MVAAAEPDATSSLLPAHTSDMCTKPASRAVHRIPQYLIEKRLEAASIMDTSFQGPGACPLRKATISVDLTEAAGMTPVRTEPGLETRGDINELFWIRYAAVTQRVTCPTTPGCLLSLAPVE